MTCSMYLLTLGLVPSPGTCCRCPPVSFVVGTVLAVLAAQKNIKKKRTSPSEWLTQTSRPTRASPPGLSSKETKHGSCNHDVSSPATDQSHPSIPPASQCNYTKISHRKEWQTARPESTLHAEWRATLIGAGQARRRGTKGQSSIVSRWLAKVTASSAHGPAELLLARAKGRYLPLN